MPVTPARVRELALCLPATQAVAHFHREAFRTPRKIFATLDVQANDLNLMFDPHLRDVFCDRAPNAFSPVPGGWGRKGATRCDLTAVDEETLASALRSAHQRATPKARPR